MLRRLELSSAPGVSRIQTLADDPELERFSLFGARTFDLSCLARFPRLRSLYLGNVAALTGVAVLPMLPLLEIGFQGVRRFDEASALADLPDGVQVSVLGSSERLLRSVAERSSASWGFS